MLSDDQSDRGDKGLHVKSAICKHPCEFICGTHHTAAHKQRHQQSLLKGVQSTEIDCCESSRRCRTHSEEETVYIGNVIDRVGCVQYTGDSAGDLFGVSFKYIRFVRCTARVNDRDRGWEGCEYMNLADYDEGQ